MQNFEGNHNINIILDIDNESFSLYILKGGTQLEWILLGWKIEIFLLQWCLSYYHVICMDS